MLLIIFSLLAHQKGFFLPEPVLAAECKRETLVSPKTKTHLIELYTSEGCSSCPPAEKWVNSLRNHKDLGKSFFPLAFHVTYWDYIGWKDPFAKKEYSYRQRKYASNWNSTTVYTPGFVLNGKEWRTPYRKVPKASKLEVGVLKAEPQKGDKYKVSFTGSGKGLRLNYALVGNGFTSKVTKGENSGRTLQQYFAVLEHKSTPFKNNQIVTIPSSKLKPKERMVAFWLDKPATMEALQAVGGCF